MCVSVCVCVCECVSVCVCVCVSVSECVCVCVCVWVTGSLQDGRRGQRRQSLGGKETSRRSWKDGRNGNGGVDTQTHHSIIPAEPRLLKELHLVTSPSTKLTLSLTETQAIEPPKSRPQNSEASRLKLKPSQCLYNNTTCTCTYYI